jgi:hypothetical protein
MPPFIVAPCTLDDGPAIARNNVSAFWEDNSWAQTWIRKNKTREYVISQGAQRWPYNLTKDPIHYRREKAVDVSTGELVGFASWILPGSSVTGEEEDEAGKQETAKLWPEARVPIVDDEMSELLKKRHEEADWESENIRDLGPAIKAMRIRLQGDKKWLSK